MRPDPYPETADDDPPLRADSAPATTSPMSTEAGFLSMVCEEKCTNVMESRLPPSERGQLLVQVK